MYLDYLSTAQRGLLQILALHNIILIRRARNIVKYHNGDTVNLIGKQVTLKIVITNQAWDLICMPCLNGYLFGVVLQDMIYGTM